MGLALLGVGIALGILPRLATTFVILGRPDDPLPNVPRPVAVGAVACLAASVVLVAVARGRVRGKRASGGELAAFVALLVTPVLALWASLGWPFALVPQLWWLLLALPFLARHRSGHLDPRVALVGAIALAAATCIPSATTYAGTPKLDVVLVALLSGWGLRAIGILVAAVLALVAARRASGALRRVSIAVALWLAAGVARDAAAFFLGAAFDAQLFETDLVLRLDRIASAADWMLAPVVALGVGSLLVGWLSREAVVVPFALLAAALFAVGPVHDPWLVDDERIEPWHFAELDGPAVLDAGWELHGVHGERFTVDAEGTRRPLDEPTKLSLAYPDVALLYASPDATMGALTNAGFRHSRYMRVFLVGPTRDMRPLRSATRRWPALGAALTARTLAIELHPQGDMSCPVANVSWKSPIPDPELTVREFLHDLPCDASIHGPEQPVPPDADTVERTWLLRCPSLPSGWTRSLPIGFALAFLGAFFWTLATLRALRACAPERRPPGADDRVWPPWVPPAQATRRWSKKRGGSPYRDAQERRFAGPTTVAQAHRALASRLGLGLRWSAIGVGFVTIAIVVSGLLWAATTL